MMPSSRPYRWPRCAIKLVNLAFIRLVRHTVLADHRPVESIKGGAIVADDDKGMRFGRCGHGGSVLSLYAIALSTIR